MIAALYSSRPGGTKNFKIKGCNFGWMAIVDLFSREVECSCSNQLRRVKDLRENFIHRDSWTRLNVKPAKITQITHLLWSCIVAIIQGLPKCLCIRIYIYIHIPRLIFLSGNAFRLCVIQVLYYFTCLHYIF